MKENRTLISLPKGRQKCSRIPTYPRGLLQLSSCPEYRPKIKVEQPGLSIGDVAKKLGEKWNNSAADDRWRRKRKRMMNKLVLVQFLLVHKACTP
jgi:hypothetical protein